MTKVYIPTLFIQYLSSFYSNAGLILTRIKPLRATAYSINENSARFGENIPILSPFYNPKAINPVAMWSILRLNSE